MKSITETIGGAQMLLDISYDLQSCFEEKLNKEHICFLHMLRVIEEAVSPPKKVYAGTGRRGYEFQSFIRSFLGMRYYRIDTVRDCIKRLHTDSTFRMLLGFKKIPSETTFSRRFKELCESRLLTKGLDYLAETYHREHTVIHINRDSTAIPAREKAVKKKPVKNDKKGVKPGKTKQSTVEIQCTQDPHMSLAALETQCSYGCKKNSQGNVWFWKGYKLHLDVTDTGFPVTALVTGANVHDSQAAIPMEKLSAQKVKHCYSLMDSAYDAQPIREYILSQGRVPVIEQNRRRRTHLHPFDPAKRERYKMRTYVERANSHLKEWLLPRALFVRGYTKVSGILMCAVLCLATLKSLHSLS